MNEVVEGINFVGLVIRSLTDSTGRIASARGYTVTQESEMETTIVPIERVRLTTSKPLQEVLSVLDAGIGHPEMGQFSRQLGEAATFTEFEKVVASVVGKSGLIEFQRLDLGKALRIDPAIEAYPIIRIIAGNPLIMRQMTRFVPDAGSYAPVTILVYAKGGDVHLCYDRMASMLENCGSPEALEVAKDLDAKVLRLLQNAAG